MYFNLINNWIFSFWDVFFFFKIIEDFVRINGIGKFKCSGWTHNYYIRLIFISITNIQS